MHASNASAQSKINRRNHAKQIQLQKRQSLLASIRIFGGVDGAPRVVAVVPLCEDVSSRSAISALSNSLALPAQMDQEPVWKVKFVNPFLRWTSSPSHYPVSPKGGAIQDFPPIHSASLRGLLRRSGCF